MDQRVRDGSRIKIKRRSDGSGSNKRSDGCYQRWIREQAMDQEDQLKDQYNDTCQPHLHLDMLSQLLILIVDDPHINGPHMMVSISTVPIQYSIAS